MSLATLLRRAPRLADGDLIDLAGFPVRLRVSARARRVSLRLDPKHREVVATAPSARRLPDALAFARERADWIAATLAAMPSSRPFAPGLVIPLRGAACRLERAAMRTPGRLVAATEVETTRLIVSGEDEAFARGTVRVLKREAAVDLAARTVVHAAALRVPLPPIAIGDARGRWGSCRMPDPRRPGDRGAIRYSWRLVCAPPAVLDYVAAHEAAHLVRADHSPAFWAVVRDLYGDVQSARAWLRRHGPDLHALGR